MDIKEQAKIDNESIDMECPLCRLYHKGEIKTKFYHRDKLCIVVECESSHVPLLVPRFHDRNPNSSEMNHMVNLLINLKEKLNWKWGYVDFINHSVLDHFHIHLR